MMRLTAPIGTKSCSFRGVEYTVVDGIVDVPEEAVDLLSHGFEISANQPEPEGTGEGTGEGTEGTPEIPKTQGTLPL